MSKPKEMTVQADGNVSLGLSDTEKRALQGADASGVLQSKADTARLVELGLVHDTGSGARLTKLGRTVAGKPAGTVEVGGEPQAS